MELPCSPVSILLSWTNFSWEVNKALIQSEYVHTHTHTLHVSVYEDRIRIS